MANYVLVIVGNSLLICCILVLWICILCMLAFLSVGCSYGGSIEVEGVPVFGTPCVLVVSLVLVDASFSLRPELERVREVPACPF